MLRKAKLTFIAVVCFVSLFFSDAHAIFKSKGKASDQYEHIEEKPAEEGYTVNFKDVSAIELVRFISKVGGLNFIYQEEDLNFKVTFTSEEPTPLFNIMSAFTQILRIHDLFIIEDGENLVIHRSETVKQIPTIVSKDKPLEKGEDPLIITRVFNIHNANPSNLESIISPMLSKASLITVSEDTRQIIITETASNIEKVAELLSILDSPKTNLDFLTYKSKNAPALQLTPLLNEIIMPLSEGNPVIIVPQKETNSIFLVSTPYLLQKSVEILKDLDTYSNVHDRVLSADNVLIYKLKYKSASSIEKALEEIAEGAENQGFLVSGMLNSIKNAHYIKSTHSMLFIGDVNGLTRIQSLLEAVDVPTKPDENSDNSKFYIYSPHNKSAAEILSYLKEVESSLKDSHLGDPAMLETLNSMRLVKNSNQIVFTGSANAISEVKELLKTLDLNEFTSSDEYLIYTPVNLSAQTLVESMHQVADRLGHANYADQGFIDAIKNAKYATYSHAIIFAGSADTIKKIKALMSELDHTDKKHLSDQNMLVYQVKFANYKTIESALDKFAETLPLESPIHEAIESASWMPEANSFVFRGTTAALAKIKEILSVSDTADYNQEAVFSYRLKHISYDQIKRDLDAYADQLSQSDPTYTTIEDMKWVPDSKILIFKGPQTSINKIQKLLDVSDQSSAATPVGLKKGYFIYNLKAAPGNVVMKELDDVADKLKNDKEVNEPLIKTIQKTEWIPSTNSIFITGSQDSIDQVKKFIDKFDVAKKSNVYTMLKLHNVQGNKILKELEEATRRLDLATYSNDSLQEVIKKIEWVKSSNSLFITGPAKDVDEVKKIIEGLDVPSRTDKMDRSDFWVYSPEYLSPSELEQSIDKLVHDLKETKLSDPLLISSLEHAKYNSSTHSFVFTANTTTLNRIKELMKTIDVNRTHPSHKNFFMYRPQHLTAKQFEDAMHNVEKEFEKSGYADTDLISTIGDMRYVDSSHSFMFTADKSTLTKLEALIKTVDVPEAAKNLNTQFLMYQPQHISASNLAESVERVIEDLKKTDLTNRPLLKSLETMREIDSTGTLLFTGQADVLQQVDDLLKKLDVATSDVSSNPNTQFFLYRPSKAKTQAVAEALKHITDNLEKSSLSDPALLRTLKSMRYVESTDSLLFTGSSASIEKVKLLLAEINEEVSQKVGIQKVGQTTFLVYKLKGSSPDYIENSLHNLAKDLDRGGNPDKALIKTINDMRYVKDSHSIIFTGSEKTLKKVKDILDEFSSGDHPTERVSAEGYILYKPTHLNGDELIHLLKDFERNLINSGVKEPKVFDVINNIKWMPKTGQLLVSGDKQATAKVKGLLEKFDHPLKHTIESKKAAIAIETLDDVSFLIYKIQFHKGVDLLGVLNGIAQDLKETSNKESQGLVKSIKSIQWLEVTNSFIANGDPKVLMRLKELLESIDVPLRQVFIEVLVIETGLTGRLDFGLRWAGQGVYKDRLAFSGGSIPVEDNVKGFKSSLSSVNATNPPLGTNMPIPTGGSLGVIGDLIFHKGKTYLSIGDLVTAVQTDSDSTVILNQKLITQDNRNSTLFVGENVPYNGSVVTNQGDNTTISANIEYRDIGVKLSLTPNIGEDNIVSLDIEQSISEEVTTGSSGGSVNSVFGIKTRKTMTDTKVHVPDRHFVAIAGQIRNTTTRVKSAIPCLGGLPIIGAAFGISSDTKNKSNVIMFIRPVIVNTYDEYKKLTERQEEITRDQGIAEDIDQGMELLKSPDYED